MEKNPIRVTIEVFDEETGEFYQKYQSLTEDGVLLSVLKPYDCGEEVTFTEKGDKNISESFKNHCMLFGKISEVELNVILDNLLNSIEDVIKGFRKRRNFLSNLEFISDMFDIYEKLGREEKPVEDVGEDQKYSILFELSKALKDL